jgi:hypothetical protein
MKRLILLTVLTVTMCSAAGPANMALSTKAPDCKLKIGDKYAGGIVFYVAPGNECHGMVCAADNQSGSCTWGDAARLCKELRTGGFTDWRMPTNDELNTIYLALYKPGLATFTPNYYWGSTEDQTNKNLAYAQYFTGSSQNIYRYVYKTYLFSVRAVRTF